MVATRAHGCVRTGGLADAQADGAAAANDAIALNTKTNPMPPNDGGAERADRGPEQQPAHLRRAVQPEGLATPGRWVASVRKPRAAGS